jgi:formylglycine-generating enzyme required for sulfatase activity
MAEVGSGGKLKVFISYSRKDLDFAQRLVSALEARGLAPKIDTRDLPRLEDWRRELLGFIREADAVVFIVSPRSISSLVCEWETEHVAKLNKRLAPIVLERVSDDRLPNAISRINYIFFDAPNDFESQADELAKALRTNLPWLKEHTRLGELAREWFEAGNPGGPHPVGLLLRSPALEEAERWLATQPPGAPPPAEITRAFILESRTAEQGARARARRSVRVIAGLAVLLIATVLSLWRRDEVQRMISNAYQPFREWHQWHVVMQPSIVSPEQDIAFPAKKEFSECAHFCPMMVVVPAGSFMMGSPKGENHDDNEGPQHPVTFAKPFAVGKFEVTFAEWDACADAGVCSRPSDSLWGRDNRPVINVSWREAQRYVQWLSRMTGRAYRLLSEAEWEYAARAGSTTAYWWGDDIGKNNANCDGCETPWEADAETAPVGSFKPNAFGLHDMHGNVWEWVEDCDHDTYTSAPTDGSAWISEDCKRRILRGGSWYEIPQYLRSANRVGYPPERQSFFYGFRIARALRP